MSEELKRALSYVEWKNLKDENRIHMIRYFIAGELYNEALKGIEQYGYQFWISSNCVRFAYMH